MLSAVTRPKRARMGGGGGGGVFKLSYTLLPDAIIKYGTITVDTLVKYL